MDDRTDMRNGVAHVTGEHVRAGESAGAGASAEPDIVEPDIAEELVSRLQVIEDQPLAERAASFVRLHDELRTRLESDDQIAPRA